MAELYPVPSLDEDPFVSPSGYLDKRAALAAPNWQEVATSIRRKKPDLAYWEIEDLIVCHLSKVLNCERAVIDDLLGEPERFINPRIVTDHPRSGKPFEVRDSQDYSCEIEEAIAANERRHCYWLYHIYGKDGRCLYVGVTRNRKGREKAHRRNWGDVIDYFSYESFQSHRDVLDAERRYIAELNPPFNHDHVGEEP